MSEKTGMWKSTIQTYGYFTASVCEFLIKKVETNTTEAHTTPLSCYADHAPFQATYHLLPSTCYGQYVIKLSMPSFASVIPKIQHKIIITK